MEPGALGRRRRRGGAFTVAQLFANGEAGGWYDPSQLTAEKVAWRRNLLTWSEQFENAAWTKGATTITANAAVAPDGTTTMDKLVETATTNNHLVNQTYTPTAGMTYVLSCFAKADERSVLWLGMGFSGGGRLGYDLTTGTVVAGTIALASGSIVPVGSGIYRCFSTVTATSASTGQLHIGMTSNADATVISYAGDGTSGLFVWGAQFEQSPTATAYQRITDFTSDFLAAFPTHGLYQDTAGTTPVTALGQPVGLVIDSKTGGLANLGPELITGGDFESGLIGTKVDDFGSVSTWTLNTTAPISGAQDGRLVITTGAFGRPYISWPVTTVAGKMYAFSFDYKVNSGLPNISQILAAGTIVPIGRFLTGSGSFRVILTATGTTNFGLLYFGNSVCDVQLDNISVREVPGVHAIQATSSSRPLLDGRVNLLTYSEQFDNAAWTKAQCSIAAGVVTTSGSGDGINQGIALYGSNASHNVRWRVAAGTATWLRFVVYQTGTTANRVSGWFDVSTGTVGTASNGGTGTGAAISVAVVSTGVYDVTLSGAVNNAATAVTAQVSTANADTSTTGVSGVTYGLQRADLRLATDAAYPYQRVAAATDYADVGVPRSFLFDGFDDSLYTASNMDLSGTDKVTVLAGVRKLSDAALGMALELGDRNNVRPGSFSFAAPNSAAANYSTTLEGSDTTGWISSSFAAPISNVYAALLNIGGSARVDEVVPRINGTVVQSVGTSSANAGTGNFGSYVLFIGRRNNASLPFNGKAYQLIVRGALTDAATLAQAERYVGARTGVFL